MAGPLGGAPFPSGHCKLVLAVESGCSAAARRGLTRRPISPGTAGYRGGFTYWDRGVISGPVCEALVRAVGLRNVIAHGYAGVRPEMVHAAATTGLADLEAFAREVATWARGQL